MRKKVVFKLNLSSDREKKKVTRTVLKAVFKLNLRSDRDKQKVMKAASGIPGVASVSIDMKDKKLTVVGDMDPLTLAIKLRKLNDTDMISLGENDGEEQEALESMMKAVFKLDLNDNQQAKQKIMRAVSNFQGVDSIAIDWMDKKLTLLGDFNPLLVAQNLRKLCCPEIISVVEKEEKHEFKKTEHKEVPDYLKVYIALNPYLGMIR